MNHNNKLALIIAYYLSRFDKKAIRNLGFNSAIEVFNYTGNILDVNPNTLKNMRDEFDPIHDNLRVGWYQRELRPSRKKVVEQYQYLNEEDIREIVKEIIYNNDFRKSEESREITVRISEDNKKNNFILRGPTGKKAEQFFISYFHKYSKPFKGKLTDTRDYGCGYDFKITTKEKNEFFIEVKGLAKVNGGALFTNKEWNVAKEKKEKYILALVSNIEKIPEINFIFNPASKLNPRKNISTTVQVNWSIKASDLTEYL